MKVKFSLFLAVTLAFVVGHEICFVFAEGAVEREKLVKELASLEKRYEEQNSALEDLSRRGADFEVLDFYKLRCRRLEEQIKALRSALKSLELRKAGEKKKSDQLLSAYRAFATEEARRTTLRRYCQLSDTASRHPSERKRDQARRTLKQMEKSLETQLLQTAQTLAQAYLDMRRAQAEFDTLEYARLLFRRRIIEDRLDTLDRALYYILELRGGYIRNVRFEKQYRELWAGLVGKDPKQSVRRLKECVKRSSLLLYLCGEELKAVRRAFLISFFDTEKASETMELELILSTAKAIRRGSELMREIDSRLDDVERSVNSFLSRLGYDLRLEERRPITFDKNGNPSDVIFILDPRAGRFLSLLEGDATGGKYRSPLPIDEKGNITLRLESASSPDPSRGELYQVYLVNLYNHHNNPGLPSYFWRQVSEDMLARNEMGETSSRTVNIWHPKVRGFTAKYFEAVGKFLCTRADFLLYDHTTWEPSFSVPPRRRESPFFGYAIQPGRSEIAKRAFRNWLQRKFRSIEKLNRLWGASYGSFDEINPPSDPFLVRRRKATALTYEHQRFLRESLADYVALACGAIMKGDPDHPVIFEMPGMMDYSVEGCFANVPLLKKVPAQMVEMHKNTFWPALPVQVYAGTVIPMYGKIPVHTEFMWNWGRRSTPSDEEEIYRQGLQTVWRNIVHGVRVLYPFSAYNWPGYGNGYMEWMISKNWRPGWRSRTGPIPRPAIACLPVSARRARRFGKLLRETRLAAREVGIIQPSTSTTNAYPYYSISWSFNVHTIESKNFHDLLFTKNYQYGYVPEEAFYDGHASMDKYPVLILPYATHFPDGFTERLLAYVRKGGTLICSGPPGLYDKYGRDDRSFIRTVFGELDIDYTGDDYIWEFEIKPRRLREGCTPLCSDGRKVLLLEGRYGKGVVLMSSIPFGQRQGSDRLVPHFYRVVDNALDGQAVKCLYDRFELVLRVKGRRKFLSICNYSLTNTLEDLIIVKGKYERIIDYGIGEKFSFIPLPSKRKALLKKPVDEGVFYMDGYSPPGYTCFWLRLKPGECTILELVH